MWFLRPASFFSVGRRFSDTDLQLFPFDYREENNRLASPSPESNLTSGMARKEGGGGT